MEKESKITINDIAKYAGVSKGTVDRVIHKRGDVSKESYEKVMNVISELGYKPNIYASMLASHKKHIIAVLIPSFKKGEYWDPIHAGILQASDDAANFNVHVKVFFYDQFLAESFRQACEKVLEVNPSGVILAPIFKNDSLNFVEKLRSINVPYIFMDSKIEDEGYLGYFGMPMYRSGYLCADLMIGHSVPESIAFLRVKRDKMQFGDPTVSRRTGYLDYVLERYPDCKIHNAEIDPNSKEETDKTLLKLFEEHPDIQYVVMFGSRVHLIVDFIEKHHLSDKMIVGFDDLDENVAALKRGTVNFLITQRPGDQAILSISAMTNYILMKKPLPLRDNYLHMNILTRYNVD